MKIKTKTIAFLSLFLFFASYAYSQNEYKAIMFGVKSDGKTDNTRSIQKAIDYISENGGGVLKFYVGRYLSGGINLKSNVTIRIEEGAVLVATPSIYDYKNGGKRSFISADNQTNVGIGGKGIIDANAQGQIAFAQEQINNGIMSEPLSSLVTSVMSFTNCKNVEIKEVTLQNSANEDIVLNNVVNVSVSNIFINPCGKYNFVSVSDSRDVKFSNCYFNTENQGAVIKKHTEGVAFEECKTPVGPFKY